MNLVLLDAKTLGEDLDLSTLDVLGSLTTYQVTAKEQTAYRISNAHIVITNKVVITKEMIQEATELKLICIAATGMNNVDLQAAADLGITVKNVSGYSTPSVVQHTFTMALHLIGKMRHYGSYATSGAWTNSQLFTDVSHPFYEISGKKWGIIGLGEIGKEVAKVATVFGAEVSYYSTSQKNLEQDYPHRSLESLLEESDIISIHAPLNAQTKNLLNKKNLHLLKDKAILLNLGRGGIVNETDIATLIDKKEIYAGLDVTETEPITLDNPLLKIRHHERLLITPHIAWASVEARERLLEGIVENIKNHMEQSC